MAYQIDDSFGDGDRCFQGPLVIRTGAMSGSLFTSAIGDTVGVHRWHPALPKIAALLAEHGDALAAAVDTALEAMQQWIDGLIDNGTKQDIIDAEYVMDDRLVLSKFAAALGTEESGDGDY